MLPLHGKIMVDTERIYMGHLSIFHVIMQQLKMKNIT